MGLTVVVACAAVLAACTSGDGDSEGPSALPSTPATAASPIPTDLHGIDNIQHVIVIVQENRSFDHYFGTFPGADGLPATDGRFTSCVPDPISGACAPPYHDSGLWDYGGPHEEFLRRRRTSMAAGWMASSDLRSTLASRARLIGRRRCAGSTTVPSANRTSWDSTTRARSPTTGPGHRRISSRTGSLRQPTRGRYRRICSSCLDGRRVALTPTAR